MNVQTWLEKGMPLDEAFYIERFIHPLSSDNSESTAKAAVFTLNHAITRYREEARASTVEFIEADPLFDVVDIFYVDRKPYYCYWSDKDTAVIGARIKMK